jgi:hypothetical protein
MNYVGLLILAVLLNFFQKLFCHHNLTKNVRLDNIFDVLRVRIENFWSWNTHSHIINENWYLSLRDIWKNVLILRFWSLWKINLPCKMRLIRVQRLCLIFYKI